MRFLLSVFLFTCLLGTFYLSQGSFPSLCLSSFLLFCLPCLYFLARSLSASLDLSGSRRHLARRASEANPHRFSLPPPPHRFFLWKGASEERSSLAPSSCWAACSPDNFLDLVHSPSLHNSPVPALTPRFQVLTLGSALACLKSGVLDETQSQSRVRLLPSPLTDT